MNSRDVQNGTDENHVSVIGAGIVGVSSALYLRLAGVPVTLFDPNGPGSGCSSGNAGMLGVDSCVPIALPGVGKSIPRMLASSDGPLGLDPSQLLSSLPWFVQFLRASAPKRVSEISNALNRLQVQIPHCYATVLSAAGAHQLVESVGKIHLYEKEQVYELGVFSRSLQIDHGVEFSILAPEEVAQMSPGLTRDVYRGVFYPNARHCINPQRMVESLAHAFVESGGTILRDRISDIEIGADGPRRLIGETAGYPVRRIVLAAGIGSKKLARRVGAKVPMIPHRGYHVMLPQFDLRLPVKSEDRKVILTPMAEGIRVTGIAEIADPDKAPVQRYWNRLEKHARALAHHPFESGERSVWVGSRPCTPDSLPVIGRSPRFPSVVLAYGHGHFGLGLGPVTGRLVCDILTGDQPLVPLEAYSPDRFAA
jgi:D-amino-acid dehydrogenase